MISRARLRELRALPDLRELAFKIEDEAAYWELRQTFSGVVFKR